MKRWLGGLLAVLLLAPLALHTLLERGAFTPRLNAALEAATGRAVSLGPIGLSLSLPPRLSVDGASIANLPGGSRADFARIGRLEMSLAWRRGGIAIRDLILRDADLLLERLPDGRANWDFPTGGDGAGMSIDTLRIEASRLTTPWTGMVEVAGLALRRRGADLDLDARLRWRDEVLSLEATLGPPAGPARRLRAGIEGDGFRLSAEGDIATPFTTPGWSLAAEAMVVSPARLAALVGLAAEPWGISAEPWGISVEPPVLSAESPGIAAEPPNRAAEPPRITPAAPTRTAAPPTLGPLRAGATIGPGPALSALTLQLGQAALLPGLQLDQASFAAAAPDRPITVTAQGRRGVAFGLTATLPSLQTLLGAAADAALPITATLTAGAARLTAEGAPTRRSGLSGTPFEMVLTAPELATLSPLFGTALPVLSGVTARARITHVAQALRLTNARLTAALVQAEGQLDIAWGQPRPSLRGRVAAQRLDLDALLPGQASATPGRLIPDIALPIEALRGTDANIAFTATTLRAAGLDWRAVNAAVALENGRLTLRDLAATTPGGPLTGQAMLDAQATPPTASLALRTTGQGFDLAALRRARGGGAGIEGPAEIALDLRGRGATTRALAETLSGEAGLAMVEGRISRAGMFNVGPNLTRILIPGGPPMEGITIRCAALRLSAQEGLAQSQGLLLESSAGRIEGSLAINLRDETLAAHLLPDIRLLGVNTRAPVSVGGRLAAPEFGVDAGQALARVLSDTIANRLWRSATLEWLRGAPDGHDCAGVLRLARLGRDGRVPPEPAASIIPIIPRELQSPVQDVLRGLGGIGTGIGQGIGSGIGSAIRGGGRR